jgi:hypothetical protein
MSKAKTTDFEEYARINIQLRREINRIKEIYMEERYVKIMDLQKKERYSMDPCIGKGNN